MSGGSFRENRIMVMTLMILNLSHHTEAKSKSKEEEIWSKIKANLSPKATFVRLN
jgi:hypothetical protein